MEIRVPQRILPEPDPGANPLRRGLVNLFNSFATDPTLIPDAGVTPLIGAVRSINLFPEDLGKLGRGIRRIGYAKPELEQQLGRFQGVYDPWTGKIGLNKAEVSRLPARARASVVRHELAHAIETEKELFKNTDSYLWGLWEKDPNHPIFEFMKQTTPYKKFNSNASPEIIAELYANHYPKMRYEIDIPGFGIQEHDIPKSLRGILQKIEDELGIWTKKRMRSEMKSGETKHPYDLIKWLYKRE